MKIEIKHKGSCLGAAGGSGRRIVRDALAKGWSSPPTCPSANGAPCSAMPRWASFRTLC